jgi:hypothetical protein
MSIFERFLTFWVALCIGVGIGLGQLLPDTFQAIGAMEVANVNLPVAGLIWLMIIPMLMKIDFAAMRQVGRHWRGIGITRSSTGRSSRSRWPCSAGCSSACCSGHGCRPARSTATSPG